MKVWQLETVSVSNLSLLKHKISTCLRLPLIVLVRVSQCLYVSTGAIASEAKAANGSAIPMNSSSTKTKLMKA